MDDQPMKVARPSFPVGLALAVTLVTALIPALFILMAGKNPLSAYGSLFAYTLGTSNGFLEVLTEAIPLTLVGLGVTIAFRAGIFNIGGDGQLLMGAIVSFAMAPLLAGLPRPVGLLVYLAAGFAGGGLLGACVGWLRVRFQASEIITSIILNFIVLQLLSWVIRGPLQEPARIMPWSDYLPDSLLLPNLIEGSRVHYGLLVAVAAVLVMALVVGKTAFGFKLTAVGRNPAAARYAGLRDQRVVVWAMLISGGLAGLAGCVQIAGVLGRLQDDFAPGYGQAAIAIALMARLSPMLVPFTALLFGVFYVGAGVLQREAGVPFPIVHIIEGVVILGFLSFDALARRRHGD
jgi:simple sugar transport system permease protein